MSIVIGISVGHDGGAALSIDGRIEFAIAEERLTRRRHARGWSSSLLCLLRDQCLRVTDIDLFVCSCPGPRVNVGIFYSELQAIGVPSDRIRVCDHHLSHALLSFASSSFTRAIVVVVDSLGNENQSESYFVADSTSAQRIGGNEPHRQRCQGIGPTYESFSNVLGLRDDECGKTMALAAFGDSSFIRAPLFTIANGQVRSALTSGHHWGAVEFLAKHRIPGPSSALTRHNHLAMNIAAYVQAETERALHAVVSQLVDITGIDSVCVAGGVGLNCVANGFLRSSLPALNFHFPGAIDDSGQACGNALFGTLLLEGRLPEAEPRDLYLGPRWDASHIKLALERHPLVTPYYRRATRGYRARRCTHLMSEIAELIVDRKIVAWWQGRSELGQRALGNRSLLARADDISVSRRLSMCIKKREWFRPLAPTMTHNEAARMRLYPNLVMSEAQSVTPCYRTNISGAMHVDGTSRVHAVPEHLNPRLVRLLQEVGQRVGAEVLLNTSFNIAEPIVETPGDALHTFVTSDIDYLVLDDWLIEPVQERPGGSMHAD